MSSTSPSSDWRAELLITGPLRDQKFQGLVRDIVRRKVVIRGLVFHYANTMRFLWLVNLNRPSA